ncbi:META domain-containing protein [uncultured Methanospirillum sp.]|uniref:META domain-containing protein n=1 Tax=uncultured Methanospirillum sp. TaxID=262503 RepID=UPI0029C6B3BB|nr:META domain-containing protein [uncultured Methanospirillum sp.]
MSNNINQSLGENVRKFSKNLNRSLSLCLLLCILLLNSVSGEVTTPSTPDGSWTVEQYRSSNGDLVFPLTGYPISVVFHDEIISIAAGCSNYTGQYTAAGGAMIIPCPVTMNETCDTSGGTQATAFIENLKNTALFQVNLSHLLLYDDDEELLISLITK